MNAYLLEKLKKIIKSNDISNSDFKFNYSNHMPGYITPYEVNKEIKKLLKFSFR
jgi:hypothetical protein